MCPITRARAVSPKKRRAAKRARQPISRKKKTAVRRKQTPTRLERSAPNEGKSIMHVAAESERLRQNTKQLAYQGWRLLVFLVAALVLIGSLAAQAGRRSQPTGET